MILAILTMPSPERPAPQPELPHQPARSEQKRSMDGVTVFDPDTNEPSYFGFVRRPGGQETYARLFKSETGGYALIVPADVDFSHIEEGMLSDLSSRLSGGKTRLDTRNPSMRARITADIDCGYFYKFDDLHI